MYASLREDFQDNKINNTLINLDNFKVWLEKEEITYDENLIDLWPYIKIDIISEIVNAQWGKNASYKIKSITDNQISQAVIHLKDK